ncbi:MotA/TolQ/ExbB proton channel family protein [Amphritea sp. 1_MG-2023]|uniref:MotA/TolQ/ExbB proton channel family protein n=1 Tax=Amphritea sp. 1_MG-2023 TaxID=3062670 RepID=UPI0026E1B784|nr:MotA/TolQ/ExbB proton channel family protein [Amphritea sp. 1_MG-2023]MDO6564140.1 MotA/TolQ/ExbB proton channel family protein [Amphritea sp. 1_MG-2023]
MNTPSDNSPFEQTAVTFDNSALPESSTQTGALTQPIIDMTSDSNVPLATVSGAEDSLTNATTASDNLGQELSQNLVGDQLDQVIKMLDIGGPVVWILIALSIFSLSIILLKLWQFAVTQPESTTDIDKSLTLWRNHDPVAAIASLRYHRPVSKIIAYAMQGVTSQQAPALLQEELSRQANQLINQLRALLRPLEVIASISPLLGLMGTVLGMIVAFQQMEAAGNNVDPSVLSGGIWQALLTTAVGLAVAIPVATAHSILERKVERSAILINDYVTQVFTCPLYQEKSALTVKEHQRAA